MRRKRKKRRRGRPRPNSCYRFKPCLLSSSFVQENKTNKRQMMEMMIIRKQEQACCKSSTSETSGGALKWCSTKVAPETSCSSAIGLHEKYHHQRRHHLTSNQVKAQFKQHNTTTSRPVGEWHGNKLVRFVILVHSFLLLLICTIGAATATTSVGANCSSQARDQTLWSSPTELASIEPTSLSLSASSIINFGFDGGASVEDGADELLSHESRRRLGQGSQRLNLSNLANSSSIHADRAASADGASSSASRPAPTLAAGLNNKVKGETEEEKFVNWSVRLVEEGESWANDSQSTVNEEPRLMSSLLAGEQHKQDRNNNSNNKSQDQKQSVLNKSNLLLESQTFISNSNSNSNSATPSSASAATKQIKNADESSGPISSAVANSLSLSYKRQIAPATTTTNSDKGKTLPDRVRDEQQQQQQQQQQEERRQQEQKQIGRSRRVRSQTRSRPRRQQRQHQFGDKSSSAEAGAAAVAAPFNDSSGDEWLVQAASNLPASSRIILAKVGSSVELTCEALDASLAGMHSLASAAHPSGDELVVGDAQTSKVASSRDKDEDSGVETSRQFVVGLNGFAVPLHGSGGDENRDLGGRLGSYSANRTAVRANSSSSLLFNGATSFRPIYAPAVHDDESDQGHDGDEELVVAEGGVGGGGPFDEGQQQHHHRLGQIDHNLNVNDYLISLVFWYKDNNPAPIYTLDVRQSMPKVLADFVNEKALHEQQQQQHLAKVSRSKSDNVNSDKKFRPRVAAAKKSQLQQQQQQQQETPLSGFGANSSLAIQLNQIAQINRKLLASAKHYRSSSIQFTNRDANFNDKDDASQSRADGEIDAGSYPFHDGDGKRLKRPTTSIRADWPLIRLRIDSITAEQAGDYKCRVDFRRARTIRQTVRLLVEVPLKRLELVPHQHSSSSWAAASDNSNQSDSAGGDQSSQPEAEVPKAVQAPVESGEKQSSGGDAVRVIRLNQDEHAEFVCRTIEGWPKPQIDWLVSLARPYAPDANGSEMATAAAAATSASPSRSPGDFRNAAGGGDQLWPANRPLELGSSRSLLAHLNAQIVELGDVVGGETGGETNVRLQKAATKQKQQLQSNWASLNNYRNSGDNSSSISSSGGDNDWLKSMKSTVESGGGGGGGEPASGLAASYVSASSKLRLNRVSRSLDRLRIGCRARQVLQLSGPSRNSSISNNNNNNSSIKRKLNSRSIRSKGADLAPEVEEAAAANYRLPPTLWEAEQPMDSQEANLAARPDGKNWGHDIKPKQQQQWQHLEPAAADVGNLIDKGAPGQRQQAQSARIKWKRSTGPGQETTANGRRQLVEITQWIELRLNLKPELVEILDETDGEAPPQAGGDAAGGAIVVANSMAPPPPPPHRNSTETDERTAKGDGGGGGGDYSIMYRKVIKLARDEHGNDNQRRRPIRFVCRSRGSRPPASLEWFWLDRSTSSSLPLAKGSPASGRDEMQPIRSGGDDPRISIKTSIRDLRLDWTAGGGSANMAVGGQLGSTPDHGNGTAASEYFSVSELVFYDGLSEQFDQFELICRATNEQLPPSQRGRSLAARLTLDIEFRPMVKLIERESRELGVRTPEVTASQNEEEDAIAGEESTDRLDSRPRKQFECLIKSNPSIDQLVWLVNEQPLARIAIKRAKQQRIINNKTVALLASERGSQSADRSDGDDEKESEAREGRDMSALQTIEVRVELFDQAETKRLHFLLSQPDGAEQVKEGDKEKGKRRQDPNEVAPNRHEDKIELDTKTIGKQNLKPNRNGGGGHNHKYSHWPAVYQIRRQNQVYQVDVSQLREQLLANGALSSGSSARGPPPSDRPRRPSTFSSFLSIWPSNQSSGIDQREQRQQLAPLARAELGGDELEARGSTDREDGSIHSYMASDDDNDDEPNDRASKLFDQARRQQQRQPEQDETLNLINFFDWRRNLAHETRPAAAATAHYMEFKCLASNELGRDSHSNTIVFSSSSSSHDQDLESSSDECLLDERLATMRQSRNLARFGPLDSIRVHQVKRLSINGANVTAIAPPPVDKLICHQAVASTTGQQQPVAGSGDQLDGNGEGNDRGGDKRFLWSFVPLDVVTSYMNERQEAINLGQFTVPTTDRSSRNLPPPLSATNSLDLSDLNKLTLGGSHAQEQQQRPGLLLCSEQQLTNHVNRTNRQRRRSPCAILLLAGSSDASDGRLAHDAAGPLLPPLPSIENCNVEPILELAQENGAQGRADNNVSLPPTDPHQLSAVELINSSGQLSISVNCGAIPTGTSGQNSPLIFELGVSRLSRGQEPLHGERRDANVVSPSLTHSTSSSSSAADDLPSSLSSSSPSPADMMLLDERHTSGTTTPKRGQAGEIITSDELAAGGGQWWAPFESTSGKRPMPTTTMATFALFNGHRDDGEQFAVNGANVSGAAAAPGRQYRIAMSQLAARLTGWQTAAATAETTTTPDHSSSTSEAGAAAPVRRPVARQNNAGRRPVPSGAGNGANHATRPGPDKQTMRAADDNSSSSLSLPVGGPIQATQDSQGESNDKATDEHDTNATATATIKPVERKTSDRRGPVGADDAGSSYVDGATNELGDNDDDDVDDQRLATEAHEVVAESKKFVRRTNDSTSQSLATTAGIQEATTPVPLGKWLSAARPMTLAEQMELLGELVFTLRVGDLVQTSETRAVYGAQMRIKRRWINETSLASGGGDNRFVAAANQFKQEPQKSSRVLGASVAGSVAQVSRSASASNAEDDDDDESNQVNSMQFGVPPEGPPPIVMLAAAGRARNSSLLSGSGYKAALLEWGKRHEVGITMAAIGATLLLSALTLTLIILLLRARQSACSLASFMMPPSPILTGTTTTTTTAMTAAGTAGPQDDDQRSPLSSSGGGGCDTMTTLQTSDEIRGTTGTTGTRGVGNNFQLSLAELDDGVGVGSWNGACLHAGAAGMDSDSAIQCLCHTHQLQHQHQVQHAGHYDHSHSYSHHQHHQHHLLMQPLTTGANSTVSSFSSSTLPTLNTLDHQHVMEEGESGGDDLVINFYVPHVFDMGGQFDDQQPQQAVDEFYATRYFDVDGAPVSATNRWNES